MTLADCLLDPNDSPERQREKLLVIADVLMRRMEQVTDDSGAAYAQFQRAAMLEDQVSARTRDLERALDLLNQSNAQLEGANRATEAARKNLANAIETVQEGFALFDAEEVLVLCNARFGMHMLDLRPILHPGLHFDAYIAAVSRSRYLELPEGETPDEWARRRLRRHQDMHVIFNVRMVWDRWVQVSEHRTPDGGTVILQTDITDIIRIEREERGKMLDDQARIIRATLDHINQGVCIFDAGGHLLGWNQRLGDLLTIPLTRFRLGAHFDQLLERFQQEVDFAPGMNAEDLAEWVRGKQGRRALSFEVRRASGMILQLFAQEMPDGGFVMSFTDITRERAAIEALSRANETLEARVTARTHELQDALADAERANASRARFVAAASHDLLQPLSAAKLFIAAIDETRDPILAATVQKAQNALDSVEGILGALLDISRLEGGRAAMSVGPLHLARILDPLREEFAVLAAAKGLRLTVMPCAALVVSDAAYLRRILQNLIGNALRYTVAGRVLVGARRVGRALRIEVWDTGAGIPKSEQVNIFKEFHRLDAPASASAGMGLGLAIVERACQVLNHPLRLRSTLGQGSCFAIEVPLASQLPQPTAPQPSAARLASPLDRIVLLVENDADLRGALTLLLEKWGVTVLEAATGEEALALIGEIGILPDGYIVDQNLGAGMSGLAFLAAINADHGPRPACLITAERDAGLQAQAALAGADLLYKPIDAMAMRVFLAALGPL